MLGILDGGYGAVAQIVADCLVREGIPGPCLGVPKPRRALKKRSETFGGSEETYEEDDVPDQVDQMEPHETLTGSFFFYLPYHRKLTRHEINSIGPSFAVILCCVVFIFALIK